MAPDISAHKRELRAELRQQRQTMPELERERRAAELTSRLIALVGERGAHSVACYESTSTEPSTAGFLDWAARTGVRVLLPVCREDGLLGWEVAGDATALQLDPTAVDEVDLVIAPASAVDRTGLRMGWGRGYYDRTLALRRRNTPVYAMIFDHELRDALPREPHDVSVTGVVTPSQTITF
jgi:5-formyltetrahydrofolate cyclo-ligase